MSLKSESYIEVLNSFANKKRALIILRWTLILACGVLVLFTKDDNQYVSLAKFITVCLVVSNLFIVLLPIKFFKKKIFDIALVLTDICLISIVLWVTGNLNSEFALLYSLVIMTSALSSSIRAVLFFSFAIPGVYLVLVFLSGGVEQLQTTSVLVRIPFLFIVATFYGYLVMLVRRESKEKKIYKNELDQLKVIRRLSHSLSESLELKEVYANLLKATKILTNSEHILICSLQNKTILDQLANQHIKLENEAIPTFIENISDAIRNDNYYVTQILGSVKPKVSAIFSVKNYLILPIPGLNPELYLAVLGEYNEELIESIRLFLVNAGMVIRKARQYNQLEVEIDKRKLIAMRLKNALEHKAEFLKHISHELKTPMCGLIGYGELLLENDYGKLSNEQKIVITKMLASSENLLEMIDDIIEFSELDNGTTSIHCFESSIGEFIEQTVRTSKELTKDKPIKIDSSLGSENLKLVTDWSLVKKITLGLLNNAIKFTPQGSIELEAAYDKHNKNLNIIVRDSGIGMDDSQLAKIFEAFSQGENGYTKGYQGAGLGLAIAKKQVELLNGKIQVESKPKVGSTFIVNIPIQ